MPFIKVWGMRETKQWMKALTGELRDQIKEEVVQVKELQLTENQVTVVFDSPDSIMNEVIVEVVGLFENPTRDDEVRLRLARAIGETIKACLMDSSRESDKTRLIEVFIDPFNRGQGFWSSAEEE